MPSHLRIQSTFEPVDVQATYQTSPRLPPAKKQKMSLTQTYYVASTARSKLGKEAGRADHNLRLLVGHANLLDNLMIELADAEREQEAWFNQSVRKAAKPDEPRHIQWIDTIAEEMEVEDDSDSDSDSEVDESELYDIPMPSIRVPAVVIDSSELDESELDEEDDEEHALVRVPSRRDSPPPELLSDDESEDESMPPSPEQLSLEYNEKHHQSLFYDNVKTRGLEDYAMQQSQPMIAAY
ncbi:hypothetical protein AMS68_000894 [Peltaster fructicola]|uniref:Uncharacterized protein n=1 Tax=Peltaster fructicola TaxID=286661 RepID=A0A6H0XKW0_9PEZI|nr:hypothetical protein AMS68_000894 [Peltaster fructicola]